MSMRREGEPHNDRIYGEATDIPLHWKARLFPRRLQPTAAAHYRAL